MTRPLRIEFPGALYRLTARGNGRAAGFLDDVDLGVFLSILGDLFERYNWMCHAYCLMGNHYHLLIETPDANLSQGQRQLNGIYAIAKDGYSQQEIAAHVGLHYSTVSRIVQGEREKARSKA